MKNFKLMTIALLALCSLTTVSCDSDDDSGSQSVVNEFSYLGTTYALTGGNLIEYGVDGDNGNGSFDFDILLTGDGITYDDASGDFSGVGEAVFLDLNSDNMTGLSDGTYVFAPDRDAFTIVDGGAFINYNLDTDTGMDIQAFSGNVVLSISGTNYDIEFNLVDASANPIAGTYNGTLTTIME